TLLDKREMWLDERSTDEREWVGPDPGISALRNSVNRHELGISSQQLQDLLMHHLGDNAQLHPTREQGVWMLGLEQNFVHELAQRALDLNRIDQDTVGWRDLITTAANRSGPHWFHVIFERDVARENPQHIFITPYHPLIRLLMDVGNDTPLFLQAESRDNTPHQAAWCVCIDWTVDSLTRTTVRRWLYLDSNGTPVLDEGARPLQLLQSGEVIGEHNLQGFLTPIQDALLESERLRLLPLLGELRDNAEHAWHQRIMREMGQLADADWTARAEGRMPDPRWVRMKNSLITKLQDELARRLADLDHIRDNLEGHLNLRVAIQIE
ncbi:MAG: hypothetical protein OSB33_07005, partial [Candidatus Poseidoniales archaeon]|nr:hypothetical protein [Candidatus Poseidoniales archaeon]